MTALRSRAKIIVPALAAIICIAAAGIVAATRAGPSLDAARQAYQKHNYKQAVGELDRLLAARPAGRRLRTVQRLKALSMCMYKRVSGYDYAAGIMAEHKPFRSDPELWLAMGEDGRQRWRSKKAYEAFVKAAELFEKIARHTAAADAWFKAAEMLKRDYNILPRPMQIKASDWQWPRRRKHSVKKVLSIYDHIVELKIDGARKARALYQAGEHAASRGDWKLAEAGIARYRRCVKEFSTQKHAPNAQYQLGETYKRFNRFVQAVREYRAVFQNYPAHRLAGDARGQIKEIKTPRISLHVRKSFLPLPGEKTKIFWRIRNVKKLYLSAKSVDLTAAVAKMRTVSDAMSVLTAMEGKVVANWTFDTPDEGKHQYYERAPIADRQTTLAISLPTRARGAYVVTASGTNAAGKTATSSCLVVISSISAVAKSDADEVLIFANDARGGEPAGGADVSVTRYWRRYKNSGFDRATGKIDDAGLANIRMPRRRWYNWIAAVRKGDDQALCAGGRFSWSWWGYSQAYKVYGFTERPVYRPGQTVHFKQIIRSHREGKYTNAPGKKVRVEIRNPKGEAIYAKDHVTDEFGAIEGDLKLGDEPPLGIYSIQVRVDGRTLGYWYAKGNRFRVEEYKKPEFKVAVAAARPDYRVGDEMKIKISARYYFGQPVVGAEVKYDIRKQSYTHRFEWPRPWKWYYEGLRYKSRWRPWYYPRFNEHVTSGTVKTDADGEAFVTIKAEAIKNHEKLDLKFLVKAEVTDASRRVIRGSGEVKVTHAPFFIYPKPAQAVYGPGDSVEITIKTENPNKQPVSGEFDVEAWRVERIRKVVKTGGKDVVEFEEKLAQKVFAKRVAVGKTGRTSVRFTPGMTGQFKIIVRQADAGEGKGKKPVEGSCYLWIASKSGAEAHYAYNDLQIVPAGDQFEIGQTMKVLVNTAKTNSRVLITGEADDLLFSRVVHVKKNSLLVSLPVGKELCPNFTLTATLLRDGKVFRDSKKIVVPPTHRFLKVEVKLARGDMGGGQDGKTYQPREKTKIRVRVTDVRTKKPVVGQVTLMLVDSSVYYIQPEFRQAIEKAFYGFTRHVRVSTADSYAGPASLAGWPGYYHGYSGSKRQKKLGVMDEASARPEMAMMKAKGDGRSDDKDNIAQLAQTIVREHFRDTVLWAGSVVTAADGTASIDVTMPDQLTTFTLHAIAADKDTRVGQASADVITAKKIIVRIESGRFFTEGDHSYVTVIAHNYYEDAQKLKIDLTAGEQDQKNFKLRSAKIGGEWMDYKPGQALDVTVPSGGEVRIDFKTTALRSGEVKLRARARGVRQSDAIQLTRQIVPWGASKLVGNGGVLRAGDRVRSAEFVVTVPRDIKGGSQSLTVTLNPSIAAVAMNALPYLARYPYGCVEQTMSRFLPLVVMRKTLQDAGVNLADIRGRIEHQIAKDPKLAARWKFIRKRMGRNPVYSQVEVDRMIASGLKRLADMQQANGSWGWWKSDSNNSYMTSYVLYGLSAARDCDVKIPAAVMDRGVKWLIDRAAEAKVKNPADWWRRYVDNDNMRIYRLFVISGIRPEALRQEALAGDLERIFAARDDLTDYGRAYLALTLQKISRKKDARIVIGNFDNTATLNAKRNTAHWGAQRRWWYWYDGADETTSWVLQAMLTIDPTNRYVPLAANYLVRSRRGLAWGNTKSTAMAVYALARYARAAGELDCDQTFEVTVDGVVSRRVRVTKANMFTFDDRLVVDAESLAPGGHTVRITRSGRGSLYWGAYLRYYDKSGVIKGGGNQLAIERTYFRLTREKFTNTRRVWKAGKWTDEKYPDTRFKKTPLASGDEIASGELIEVNLAVTADHNFEYMIFEDPKPSGCEPYRLTSGSSYGGGRYANMELRDTRIVFFAAWLKEGRQSITYRLRCEQPGTFRVLPASGEAMYTPFVEAVSDSGLITITEKPDRR